MTLKYIKAVLGWTCMIALLYGFLGGDLPYTYEVLIIGLLLLLSLFVNDYIYYLKCGKPDNLSPIKRWFTFSSKDDK